MAKGVNLKEMEEKKRSYESIVVISTKMGEEKIKDVIDKFRGLISSKAVLDGVDEWGKKELSYPINYEKEGYYVLFKFSSDPKFSAELDRVYNITDGVMRTLIVAR